VGGEENIIESAQFRTHWKWLHLENIQRRPADMAIMQGLYEGVRINQATTGGIYQDGSWPHLTQRIFSDEVIIFFG
jgi:hypothetical protein